MNIKLHDVIFEGSEGTCVVSVLLFLIRGPASMSVFCMGLFLAVCPVVWKVVWGPVVFGGSWALCLLGLGVGGWP